MVYVIRFLVASLSTCFWFLCTDKGCKESSGCLTVEIGYRLLDGMRKRVWYIRPQHCNEQLEIPSELPKGHLYVGIESMATIHHVPQVSFDRWRDHNNLLISGPVLERYSLSDLGPLLLQQNSSLALALMAVFAQSRDSEVIQSLQSLIAANKEYQQSTAYLAVLRAIQCDITAVRHSDCYWNVLQSDIFPSMRNDSSIIPSLPHSSPPHLHQCLSMDANQSNCLRDYILYRYLWSSIVVDMSPIHPLIDLSSLRRQPQFSSLLYLHDIVSQGWVALSDYPSSSSSPVDIRGECDRIQSFSSAIVPLREFWGTICELVSMWHASQLHSSDQTVVLPVSYISSMLSNMRAMGSISLASRLLASYLSTVTNTLQQSSSIGEDGSVGDCRRVTELLADSTIVPHELLVIWINTAMEICIPTVLLPAAADSTLQSSLNDVSQLQRELLGFLQKLHRNRVTIDASSVQTRGLFLLAYQGLGLLRRDSSSSSQLDSDIPTAFNEIVTIDSLPSSTAAAPWQRPVSGNVSPRIAFLSAHWREHSVGRLFAKVIEGLINLWAEQRESSIDVYIVHIHSSSSSSQDSDPITSQFYHNTHNNHTGSLVRVHWIVLSTTQSSLSQLTTELLSLRLDVLVYSDIHMSHAVGSLARNRLARSVVMLWGHPYTTGYRQTVDYYVTSVNYEFLDGKRDLKTSDRMDQYSEQLVLFESLSFLMYPLPHLIHQKAQEAQEGDRHSRQESFLASIVSKAVYLDGQSVNIEISSSHTSHRFYGALQTIMKMHPLFDEAILQLLEMDEAAIVFLSYNSKQYSNQLSFQRRLLQKLTDPRLSKRVILLPQGSHQLYQRYLCHMDVNLDPFPFGGGVTLVDSLTGCEGYSVPIVTSAALQTVIRIGNGISKALETCCPGLVTNSDGDCEQQEGSMDWIGCQIQNYVRVAYDSARNPPSANKDIQDSIHDILYHDSEVVKEYDIFLSQLLIN